MDVHRKPNGRYEVRWREGTSRHGRTFDRRKDAVDFVAWMRRRKQLGQAAVAEDVRLDAFIETYWRLHAVPNLRPATRDIYKRIWTLHIKPRLGDQGIRELTPKRLTRFRAELEQAEVGNATVVKALAIVQSVLSLAVTEEIVEYNAAAAVRKPRYERLREPHIFLPRDVEAIRASLDDRDRTLVSVLAYSGPRPEEVVSRLTWGDIGPQAIRYVDTKRHRVRFTPLLAPLAQDLREWRAAQGHPDPAAPVFPAHDGGFWDADDWRNWRQRVWKGRAPRPRTPADGPQLPSLAAAPAGTRPRDLRSSYITLRVYEGIPLTQIGREVGTSVRMIEQHYAGVIANWDGKQVPAETQIRRARQAIRRRSGRGMDALRLSNPRADDTKPLRIA